jgi:hypothetical protein
MMPETVHLDAMSELFTVVDSFEKLEIVVHLYRTRFRMEKSSAIGRCLSLSPRTVADSLAALFRAGVVLTSHYDDDAGWWLDPNSCWATSIEVLVELYELDRDELLGFMKHVAFQRVRSRDVRSSGDAFARPWRHSKPTAPN